MRRMDAATEETFESLGEGWYDNDLQLAAELGKALLEQNRDLESQQIQNNQIIHDQALEIEHLTKQLESAREVSESRMRIHEDLDRTNQELEKTNSRLRLEVKTDKQRIEELSSTINCLEEKSEELRKKVDELKVVDKKRKKQENRRSQSLASLRERERNGYHIENVTWTYNDQFKNLPLNPYEVEIKRLQESVSHLKTQNMIERRKRENLQLEVVILLQENQLFEDQNKKYEEQLLHAEEVERELEKARMLNEIPCKYCGNSSHRRGSKISVADDVEHDQPEIKHNGEVAKLEDGGSVYGSRESLNIVSESKEIISSDDEILNSGVSILNELESQYHSLFQKYETLIQNRSKRPTDLNVSHKEVQTFLEIQKRCDLYDEYGEFTGDECGSPPYKSIFRDIFATLKKTKIDESSELTSPTFPPGHGVGDLL